jgi:serine/threonine protein kinase
VSCTVHYAAPEAINARAAGAKIIVEPSLDIWAVGVIMFECITGGRAFHIFGDAQEVYECAEGAKMYPWEVPAEELPMSWRRSRARKLFSDCLSRDPAARPTAQQLLQSLSKLSDATSLG